MKGNYKNNAHNNAAACGKKHGKGKSDWKLFPCNVMLCHQTPVSMPEESTQHLAPSFQKSAN